MLKLHPEVLKKNGKNEFVVLPYEEFVKIQEALEDADDLRALRTAKRRDSKAPGISLAEVRRRLNAKK
jgi:PHD/YefM family antitoxin component YafN of YafNO toxin-antitoxin module